MQAPQAVARDIATPAVCPPGKATRRSLDQIELRDWKATHRDLSPQFRDEARSYVIAIISRDPFVRESSPAEQQEAADRLWRRFRDLYDSLHHTEREDFMRAMSLM